MRICIFSYNIIVKKHIQNAKASGKCKCEICGNSEILINHHIKGRDIPNANHKSNLCLICSNCHMGIHYGNIIIEKWVMTSCGNQLFWHKKGENSFTGEDSTPPILASPSKNIRI